MAITIRQLRDKMAIYGRDIKLKFDGVPLLGTREKTYKLNGEALDVSDDYSNGYQVLCDKDAKNSKAITIRQLRDNITAMAEGAPGAPRIKGEALFAGLPSAVNASSVIEENTQSLLVSSYTDQFGLKFGCLSTDGSVPAIIYAEPASIVVSATYNNSLKYATLTTITFSTLVGTMLVKPSSTGWDQRDVYVEQRRGGNTIYLEYWVGTIYARPILTVQSGDVIIVGIEQNSDNCTVELAWRPVFKVAYPVAVI